MSPLPWLLKLDSGVPYGDAIQLLMYIDATAAALNEESKANDLFMRLLKSPHYEDFYGMEWPMAKIIKDNFKEDLTTETKLSLQDIGDIYDYHAPVQYSLSSMRTMPPYLRSSKVPKEYGSGGNKSIDVSFKKLREDYETRQSNGWRTFSLIMKRQFEKNL